MFIMTNYIVEYVVLSAHPVSSNGDFKYVRRHYWLFNYAISTSIVIKYMWEENDHE